MPATGSVRLEKTINVIVNADESVMKSLWLKQLFEKAVLKFYTTNKIFVYCSLLQMTSNKEQSVLESKLDVTESN